MKELTFKKLSNRWFIDIPYEGSIEDLEMVAGADKLLDAISYNNDTIKVKVYDKLIANAISCTKIDETDFGATYMIDAWDNMDCNYSGTIWLCNVTKIVLGEFPENIYFRI